MVAGMVTPMSCDSPVTCPGYDNLDKQYIGADLADDQLKALLMMEKSYVIPFVPCRNPSNQGKQLPYGDWRRKICQWSFRVVDHFRLDREVVSASLNIFDRYLATRPKALNEDTCPCPACQKSIDSRTFQLTAMTSLYLAMKMYSVNSDAYTQRKLSLAHFVDLSRGQFTAVDVSKLELSILKELQWKINPPTPLTTVSYLLRLMPSRSSLPHSCHGNYDLVLHVLHELARYLSELSGCLDSVSTFYSSSQIAYASILVSMELMTYSSLPLDARKVFNDRAFRVSLATEGALLTPMDEAIQKLRGIIRNSFWPEMLMENCDGVPEAGHPIFMAREFGLLDDGYIAAQRVSHQLANNKRRFADTDLEDSPKSVSRGPIYS